MPVVFRESGLRYYFFSNEGSPREPMHIHVKGRGCDAKMDRTRGDSFRELRLQCARAFGYLTDRYKQPRTYSESVA
jgi:hypothetical protein